jgi:TrmH family RNA methyltransferase
MTDQEQDGQGIEADHDDAQRVVAPGPILVLVEPQDIVNIAAVVRLGMNFEVDGIRLVAPAIYDPYRIEGIAHNTAAMIDRVEIYQTLAEATRDCVHVVGLTARERAAKRRTVSPREAAAELVERRAAGPVALVAGREDKGLTNDELDLCQVLAVIPTNPGYRSLNLAQAVCVATYEIWLERTGGRTKRKPPRRKAGPAPAELLEQLFTDWERALHRIDFFKTRQPDLVMRSLREVLFRTTLDVREAALIRAMGIEVDKVIDRIEGGQSGTGPDSTA